MLIKLVAVAIPAIVRLRQVSCRYIELLRRPDWLKQLFIPNLIFTIFKIGARHSLISYPIIRDCALFEKP